MAETEKQSDIASLTVELLSAYLSNNTVPSADLARLIQSTRAALTPDTASVEPEAEKPTFTPAVTARKSLASPDHIISLIDGKPYKALKRHLARHGLTPETYRERFGLPASYPMVAPAFAAMRRAIAEKIGLGNRRAADALVPADAVVDADSAGATEVAAPVVANSKKQVAKTPVVKAAKAHIRKAKSTSKSVVASADTVPSPIREEIAKSPVEPNTFDQTVETTDAAPTVKPDPAKVQSSSTKPKKLPAKRMARAPKPAAKSEASGSVPEESLAAETADVAAVAEKPKRRGKLGLFGKEPSANSAEGENATPVTGPAKALGKRPAAKAK